MVAQPAPAAEIGRPVQALVDRLGHAESIDACRDLMVEAVLDYGWKILYFVSLSVPVGVETVRVLLTNLPDDWRRQYLAAAADHTDPIVAQAARSMLPVTWEMPDRIEDLDNDVGTVMAAALAAGLVRGASFPVHGPVGRFAVLNVGTDQPRPALDRLVGLHGPELQYLALHLEAAVERCAAAAPTDSGLTRREMECLHWAAQGKTSWETARILEVAEVTVNFHLKNVMKKLSVSNRVHAVARAVALGLIAT